MLIHFTRLVTLAAFCLPAFALPTLVHGEDLAADRGYEVLTEKATLTSDFTQRVFDQVWQVWPEPLRKKAEQATKEQRRKMAFHRYGLTTRPGDDSGKPLQYVVDDDGKWTMNCLSCHGGSVYGSVTVGAPNNRFALQTMTEEIRAIKFRLGEPLSRMDLGSVIIPLGTTHGTTNAVVFGMGLMSHRDEQLNVIPKIPESFVHHDMDAPPWWNFHKKPSIYIDGFAQKGHRALMQFMLIPENGPDFFGDHEDDFRDVYALLDSLRAPTYEGLIETDSAERGRIAFESNCAECHGSYGKETTYPNRRIPLAEIGTDPVRLTALTVAGREKYGRSWFAHAETDTPHKTETDPDGYVAPPLDGIWASPPYFHNGSVPTLWHVLHPDDRPKVWQRTDESMDEDKVGFKIREIDRVPLAEKDPAIRRTFFDTRRFGKSNSGHNYPDQLTETEKQDVLEYLKTL
ncbi:MAG: c-type cytochrome [Rubripirellula sp.]|nr:c-type cytochrome [Rubripirellula sp.]